MGATLQLLQKIQLHMKHILVNYNFRPDWVIDEDYLIYDRSDSKDYLKDFDQDRIIYTSNIGNVDYDKLSYLVDNYDNLPDVFLWSKSNLYKYVTKEEYDKVKDNQFFTSLLTQNHRTYSDDGGIVCYYDNGMYYERADSWYFGGFASKYVTCWEDWCDLFNLPKTFYIPFAPGGSYILTREIVHKYPKEFYQKMRDTLT